MSNFAMRKRLLASTIISGMLVASAASAQTTTQPGTAPQDARDAGVVTAEAGPQAENTVGEIVVTGSLIRNPNLTSASPVNSVSEAELTLRAPLNAEEALRSLPGVVPGLGAQVNNGANGTNTVDLRGLGAQRNLVLLDGNRLVPATASGAVDLNIIPLALLQSVAVLTGGASTTYGADAVSGVVNFITRRDFTGIDFRANYRIPERGAGRSYRADLTLGANFADDRGNAVLSLGYTKADPIYQTRGFALFGVSPTTGRASGASLSSSPTTVVFPGNQLQVDPTGTALVPFYQGFNFNPYNIFQTPVNRKTAYGAARYEVADGIEVYARGLFTNNSISTIVAPSGAFGLGYTTNANNPYLTPTIRSQLCAANFATQTAAAAAALTGANPNPGLSAALTADAARYTPVTCAAQTGTTGFVAPTVPTSAPTTIVPGTGVTGNGIGLPAVYRRSVELGPRISVYETNVYDARAGARFNITSSLKLDVNGSYGRSELTQTQSGYTRNSRIIQALAATSTTTCVDASNGCVPLNLFGPAGSITPAMAGFIAGQSSIRINTTLRQAQALLSGDFGYTVPFASNPINFAVGSEYREYTYQRIPDTLAQDASELGGSGGAILPFKGSYDVREAFGEIIAPIVSDKPFAQEVTLEGGIRYSSYRIKAQGNPRFTTTTYKGAASWVPVEGVRLRGNYQRAVRAPNIGELFQPVVTSLDSLTVDPCNGANPVNNANLRSICLAQGAPAASIGAIPNPNANQPNVTGGGNPNLKPEKADSITAGMVLTPRALLPGFSLSVDYFYIRVRDAITAATTGDIIAACFGNVTATSAASAACTGIRRNPASGALSGPAATTPGLPQPTTNLGRYKTDGIDLTANYKREIGEVGLNLNFIGNYTRSLKFKASPTSYNRNCVGYYSANCGPATGNNVTTGQLVPKYSFQQRTTLSYGPTSLSLLWRWINKFKYEGQASDFVARGFTAANNTLFSGVITNAAGINSALAGRNVNFNRIPAVSYFDLSAQVNANRQMQLTFTVQNLLDKNPPLTGAPGVGSTVANSGNTFPSTYDTIGRTFSVTARLKL